MRVQMLSGSRRVAVAVVVAIGIVAAGSGMVIWRGLSSTSSPGATEARVWVATEDAPAGVPARQAAESAARRTVPIGAAPPRALASAPPDGAVTSRPLLAGQILTERDFTPTTPPALTVPPGRVAVAVDLPDAARVGRFVQPGSLVRMFRVSDGDTGDVVLDRVLVLARGAVTRAQAAAGPASNGGGALSSDADPPTSEGIVTVAVRAVDAPRVLAAAARGELALGLLPERSTAPAELSPVEAVR